MARGRSSLNSGSKQKEELPKAKITRQTLSNISRLLSYLRPYRWKFVFAMVFLFMSSLVGLAFPSFIGALIDAAQGRPTGKFLPGSIQGIGILALAVLFSQAFISFFRIVWFVQVAERSLADIRR